MRKPCIENTTMVLEAAKRFGMARISNQLMFIGAILAMLTLTNGAFMFYETANMINDAQIINSMGIVRGSIQRAAKLEGVHLPTDKVIGEIDNLLSKFTHEEKGYRIGKKQAEFANLVKSLERQWNEFKATIEAHKLNPSDENKIRLIRASEDCWVIANDAVYGAQYISESKVEGLRNVFLIIGVNILGIMLILWLVKRYVRNKLEHLALHDPLTGLNNRYSHQQAINAEMNKAARYDHDFSLMILDIDFFKSINDAYGHKVGDKVLTALAGILNSSIRNTDHLARIGGEEFAIIAPFTNLKNTENLAEKIRLNVEAHNFPEAEQVTVSVGVAEFRKNDNGDKLFNRADAALYTAKEKGRNRVVAV